MMVKIALLLAALLAVAPTNAQLPAQPDPVCVPAGVQATVTPVLRNLQGQTVPRPLQNARAAGTLPEKLPTDILLSLEGGTYFWLYRQIFNLLGWAPCPLTPQPVCLQQPAPNQQIPYCAPTPQQAAQFTSFPPIAAFCGGCKATPYPTPQGWQTLAVLNVSGTYAGAAAQTPVGAVLKPAADNTEAKQLVVVLRGAAFNGDSAYSNNYAQTPAGPYGAGAVHAGYKDMADQIWGALSAVLDAEVVNGASDGIKDILIGGHSVGGGLGTLLSTRTESYLAAACAEQGKCQGFPSGSKPKVSLVAFGSVNVGDAAFVQDFNTRINARVVDYEKDRTQQFLISRWPVLINNGVLQQPNPAEKYVRIAGALPITASDMPFQSETWGSIWYPGESLPWPQNDQAFGQWGLSTPPDFSKWVTIDQGIPQPRAQVFSASTHVCSYMCKMSTYIQGEPGDWCLLAKDDTITGTTATYCSQFPPYSFARVFPLRPEGPAKFPCGPTTC